MKKTALLILLVLSVFASVGSLCAMDSFTAYLLSLVDIQSDTFGTNPVDTYEDVEPIRGIGPKLSGTGPILHPSANGTYNPPITEAKGQELLDYINANNGAIYSPHPFTTLLNNGDIFYVDGGGYYEAPPGSGIEVWQDRIKSSFPFDYSNTSQPHSRTFHLCVPIGSVEYIPPFTQSPNVKSCDHNRSLCDYVNHCTEEVRESGDEDGDGIPNEVITPENHPPSAPYNMYKNLMTIALGHKITASGVDKDQSGIKFTMVFKDRTPPRILGCSGGDFPEIGATNPSSTGDFYRMMGLVVEDNSTRKVATALAFGRIFNHPTTTSWQNEEGWEFEQAKIIDSGDDNGFIMMPNSCHGVMRYSLFAWDENGLVNPGEPLIVENSPESCYGLRSPPVAANLSRDPIAAQPWPVAWPCSFDFSTSSDINVVKANFDPGDKRGEGIVHVRDNDRPNVVIRLESVKDGKRIYFPPVPRPGDISIVLSSKFKEFSPDTNASVYNDFVANYDSIETSFEKMQIAGNPLYFNVVKAIPPMAGSPGAFTPADMARVPRLVNDAGFIRKHVRLEEYFKSDTRQVDALPDDEEASFGERNGFGERIVAVLEFPGDALIQEDVEYIVSVWADDNTKWANIDSTATVLPDIIPVPTGIVEGNITVDIPNQIPRFNQSIPLNTDESVNGNLRVVFREPTPNVPINDEDDLIAAKFPSIEVKVKDYNQLKREIKLYLRISNENPNIRVIDRKHERRN